MISDEQVKKLFLKRSLGMNINECADQVNMCGKTASKYLKAKQLPSQLKKHHTWRTRKDPFAEIWPEVLSFLDDNQGFEAKFLFDFFQRCYIGKFQDGQLRTFQRKIRQWKATEGSGKEVCFEQIHYPGRLAESDFTDMNKLKITINGVLFNHKLYHFVLTYSNWETGTICFSESYETLAFGFQNAVRELGAVPLQHRTDCLSAAVNNLHDNDLFTKNYKELMKHYKVIPQKTNPASPNENGDVEQSHYRLLKIIKQWLLLRGSNDFRSRKEYELFLKKIFEQRNAGRTEKLKEEYKILQSLPKRRLDDWQEFTVRVTKFSTIRIKHKVYSVHSRLIREKIKILLFPEYLKIKYGHKIIDKIPRLCGKKGAFIQYRHIIDSLVRKPGAFEDYKYKEEMFPTTNFRIVYDILTTTQKKKGTKIYLQILQLASKENETLVEKALINMLDSGKEIKYSKIQEFVKFKSNETFEYDNNIPEINLNVFDELLTAGVF
ncbi:MAG: IS21 family transposase [Patescibacteria group bacterium]|nr:IS21 family transposase [Patescibacteria group bacterium]